MGSEKDQTQEAEKELAVGYVHTTGLPRLFHEFGISLFVTTYQAQRILCFTAPAGQKMSMLMRVFPRPTGIALEPTRLAMCAKNQIWFFKTATDVRGTEGEVLPYDLIFTPRRSHVTGDIAAHQITWHHDDLLVVNTRFSCLCTLDPDWSFVPGWRPPFISACVPEDRCHLNGFCLDAWGPKYATALGSTDTKEGWRENKACGGVLIDIPSGEIVVRGLSMPHTPLLHHGQLWLLESGKGALLTVDQRSGRTELVASFPGFLRGLAFFDRFAFIGLSKIREKRTFGGLPIENELGELKCAIYVYDIVSRSVAGYIEFTKGIEELFDIQVLHGPRNPHIIGFEEETIDGLMVLPP